MGTLPRLATHQADDRQSEAAASAYSLYDYIVADELGGEDALDNLRRRAWDRGIRLACDMVPNHVGIYSKWVIEHPDWFLQRDHPPFPAYQFTGEDLSHDGRVGLFIEDGYWDRRDAAVVFKRVDNATGETRYIYHGNDGTNMPWNDTAQLNYLIPQVREAVIQTIVHVARQFPVIRFDAAMTLAKKHYQRLWFPRPEEAGAIPSRAEEGMSRHEFDAAFPAEFWREVVDRVNSEAPDTLLLAEAFWLMEGYFVRTLGMHRVYNSAFMNMLKMEENSKYRDTVKNVLEFSPEVLKRFVNFMNNPDEETAIEQFGKGDKYFGVAMMMVTMPGLPMFGHGQVEGFREKYGMEYRRAYWDEHVDDEMVYRHETEIFPLMRKRYLFSESGNFAFYDFRPPEGHVDENVFAYSNRANGERALILYNNAYNTTHGTIHTSTAINAGGESETNLVRRTLGEALELRTDDGCYYVFRDHRAKLEYVRSGRELAHEGITVTLHAYEYRAFLDFKEVWDRDGAWAKLAAELKGDGVPNMGRRYRTIVLEPLTAAFQRVMNGPFIKALLPGATGKKAKTARKQFVESMHDFLVTLEEYVPRPLDPDIVLGETLRTLDEVYQVHAWLEEADNTTPAAQSLRLLMPDTGRTKDRGWAIPVIWAVLRPLGQALGADEQNAGNQDWMSDWLLTGVVARALAELGSEDWEAAEEAELAGLMLRYGALPSIQTVSERGEVIDRMFRDSPVRDFLYINRAEGVWWLNKEQYDSLMGWLLFCAVSDCLRTTAEADVLAQNLQELHHHVQELLAAAASAEYRVEPLVDILT